MQINRKEEDNFEGLEKELRVFKSVSPSREGLRRALSGVTAVGTVRSKERNGTFNLFSLRSLISYKLALPVLVATFALIITMGRGGDISGDELVLEVSRMELDGSQELDMLMSQEDYDITELEVASVQI